MTTFASIVPLIGGETIGSQQAFGRRPEWLASYEPFMANDSHLVEYYKGEVPYHILEQGGNAPPRVDVINTVCPCAGLSSLSPHAATDRASNKWMIETAKWVLGESRPEVFWGENAPRFVAKMGRPIVAALREIGKENGYTMSVYKTKSRLHGLGQIRDRCFYFFWRGDRVPTFPWFLREPPKNIDTTILEANVRAGDPMSEMMANDRIPSQDPFYRYVLEEIEPMISHREFHDKLDRTWGVLDYIEAHTTYDKVATWMSDRQMHRESARATRMFNKLKSGGNIMRKHTEIPVDKIGAFVGHLPSSLTHPQEDRYLNVRECLHVMGLPDDFELQGGRKSLNHICQNVPVSTSKDMADSIQQYLDRRLDTFESDFLVQDNRNRTLDYGWQWGEERVAHEEVFA